MLQDKYFIVGKLKGDYSVIIPLNRIKDYYSIYQDNMIEWTEPIQIQSANGKYKYYLEGRYSDTLSIYIKGDCIALVPMKDIDNFMSYYGKFKIDK